MLKTFSFSGLTELIHFLSLPLQNHYIFIKKVDKLCNLMRMIMYFKTHAISDVKYTKICILFEAVAIYSTNMIIFSIFYAYLKGSYINS